jgi:MYXO-CTERM domain-containing protein
MRAARVLALGLLLASAAAPAAVCDGPCSITMDFANGGTLTAAGDGATLTFGTGGALVLGAAGAITLGTGGSLTPNVDPPDMSLGGALVLGAGGSVQFGTGGWLDSGAAGGITPAEGGGLAIAGAVNVSVDSAASVHLGDLNTAGTARVSAGGAIDGTDTSSPIHVDTTGSIDVASDADVTFSSIAGGSVELITVGPGPGFADCSQGCPVGGTGSLGNPNIPTESGTLTATNQGAGAPGLMTLLAFAFAGLLRRR